MMVAHEQQIKSLQAQLRDKILNDDEPELEAKNEDQIKELEQDIQDKVQQIGDLRSKIQQFKKTENQQNEELENLRFELDESNTKKDKEDKNKES